MRTDLDNLGRVMPSLSGYGTCSSIRATVSGCLFVVTRKDTNRSQVIQR